MDDVEKILQAIQSQRWFFFRNNDKILFDRDTALIWANLDYFPYCEGDGSAYSSYNSYQAVGKLIKETNSNKWGSFSDWRVPKAGELWKIASDKTFPFRSASYFYIKDCRYWCVDWNNGSYAAKDLMYEGATSRISTDDYVCVIPCSNSIAPENFCVTPQEVLDIFTGNKLIPVFNDNEVNLLYKKLFIDKSAPKKELQVQNSAPLVKQEIQLIGAFDYKPIVAKFNLSDLGRSPIKYFEAVLSLTDELLNVLQEYETAHKKIIAEFLKIALKLNAKYIDNPNLTAEENKLLAERQKFLATSLELGIDTPKQKILSVKAQAENFFEQLDKISEGNNFISELAALQAEPRADFELLVESLSRIITDAQRKADFFDEHKEFVSNLVKAHIGWSNDYKAFKTSLREEFAANCREDSVDEEIFASWYEDWRIKRFAVEQRFLPLVKFGLKSTLNEEVAKILWILGEYRGAMDKFYLHERKNIYQKFAFTAGGDLQEKFETESEFYKLSEKFQHDLQEIIFSRDKTEERIFLLRWAEPLLNISIDEISNFIRDKELDAISEEVLTQFAELRRENFATYIADSKSYSKAVQKREKEFNALIFRMRKDLRKN